MRTALTIVCLLACASAVRAESPTVLRVFVDQPGEGDIVLPEAGLVRQDAGHVFVELADLRSGDTTGRKGFYPRTGVLAWLGPSDEGEIRNDVSRHYEVWIEFPIGSNAYCRALEFVESSAARPPRFDLGAYNCVDWAVDVALRAGVVLPDPETDRSVWSDSSRTARVTLWRGSSPAAFGRALLVIGGRRDWRAP